MKIGDFQVNQIRMIAYVTAVRLPTRSFSLSLDRGHASCAPLPGGEPAGIPPDRYMRFTLLLSFRFTLHILIVN